MSPNGRTRANAAGARAGWDDEHATGAPTRAGDDVMGRRLLLVASIGALAAAGACRQASSRDVGAATADGGSREAERHAMVLEQIQGRAVRDERVLHAMRTVPRHRFVPAALQAHAYADAPLPIGRGQTISQPYIVAYMADALRLRPTDRVLEVGSGSGYAAAVLSLLAGEVYGIELEQELYERSVATIDALGYANVHLRHGDGFAGWPEKAPFDAIVLSCAAEEIPPPLWAQLAEGGRILYPRGPAGGFQELVLVTRASEGPRHRQLAPVQFVPMRRAR